ncbi:diacylglycerol kinase family protein [Lentibacillus lipolyticus]|nr:diacylglycerol kinase family protein [Lentibacillus lipolyticus]
MSDRPKKPMIGFVHAWNGLKAAARTERNFRFHLVAAVLAAAAGFVFRLDAFQWALIMLATGMVMTAELINTAIEKMLDYLKPDIHPQAKLVKDIAAGAVFISAVFAAAAGLFIFLPELYAIFQ